MRLLLAWLALGVVAVGAEPTTIRVGHFPNITHAQAVIAHGMSRAGRGWFEERLGPGVKIQWYVYNAGPSAMEAILTGALDVTYVGPSPAINAHVRTGGADIRIVAGACSGGAALVVQGDGRIRTGADFRGKKVGTPQLGNTQDVAARAWLQSKGHRVTLTGGDVLVIPTANPDQLALFRKGNLDAVWTVEPWVTRLEREAGGRVYLEESALWPEGRYVTTHLVSSVKFLREHPELLKRWIAAHVELTEWIQAHPREAQQAFRNAITALTTHTMSEEVIRQAWSRLVPTYDPLQRTLLKSAEDAYRVGLVKTLPDLSRIYDLRLLQEVLRERGLPAIE